MAALETQERITNLGKQLVASLGKEHEVGVLERWMAHYIAEQIEAAEQGTGDKKTECQKRCFDTILSLWKHRSLLPCRIRPFRNFEPIFETLSRLNPDEPRFFFRQASSTAGIDRNSEIEELMRIILDVDKAARVLISEVLASAVQQVLDQDVKTYLSLALEDEEGPDVRLIAQMKSHSEGDQTELIQKRLDHLDRFLAACQSTRDVLSGRLKTSKRKVKKSS